MIQRKDRAEFLRIMAREGMPKAIARLVMRDATTVCRLATESCNRRLTGAESRRWQLAEERIAMRCSPYKITPRRDALHVRLMVPSGRDAGWGGVFVPVSGFKVQS